MSWRAAAPPVYAWIAGDRPGDVVADARARVEQGFSAVKMNATGELDYIDDHRSVDAVIERVAALRDAFGAGLRIAVDFHGRVHRAMARALLAELDRFGLMWVEEPLGPGYEDALPEVARVASRTPIATGERLVSRWEFKRLLETRVVDILQPDVSLTGLFELEKICRMAEAYDIAVAPHCPNGPVSLAASLQVGFCAGNVVIQEQSLGLHYNRGYAGLPSVEMHDYLRDPAPLTPRQGSLTRPPGAGLGIDIDEDVVRERLTGPDGRLDTVLPLPVSHPTSCAFGGPDLADLYVTTASAPLTGAERAGQPLAGRLLRLRPGATGISPVPVARVRAARGEVNSDQ